MSMDVLKLNGLTGGIAARLLQNNMDLNILRTNAILQKDDWVDLDRRVVQIAQEHLTVVQDLMDDNLVYNLGGIGDTISQWQTEGDMSPATVSMEPDSEGIRDVLNYEVAQVPIPIIHKDFKLGIRQIDAGRRAGSNIDMTNADAASRRVAVGMEDLVIKGYAHTIGGGQIWGLTNHPMRITESFLTPFAVETAADMILRMIALADEREYYGPFNLYVPTGLSTILYGIIPNTNGKMLKEHLEQIDLIRSIKVSSRLSAGQMVLLQMDSSNIDIAVGQSLMPVEWDEKGGMVVNYKVLTAMAPRLKARQDGGLGVVHATFPLAA